MIALSLAACGGSAGADAARDEGGSGAQRQAAGGPNGGGAGRGGESGGGSSGIEHGGTNGGGVGAGGSANGGSASGGDGAGQTCAGTPLIAGSGACRTQADCHNGGYCMENAPTGAGLCGACFPTVHECGVDDPCDAGEVCVTAAAAEPCQCMGPDSRCLPKCTTDSCGADQVCGADGRCAPKSCEQGYVCPSGTVCDPTRAVGHGCATPRCDLNQTTCGAEEVCDASVTVPQNRCRPKRCSEGAVCGKNQRCGGASDFCERLTCTTDADCDCGACIQGACRNQLFMCVLLPA